MAAAASPRSPRKPRSASQRLDAPSGKFTLEPRLLSTVRLACLLLETRTGQAHPPQDFVEEAVRLRLAQLKKKGELELPAGFLDAAAE